MAVVLSAVLRLRARRSTFRGSSSRPAWRVRPLARSAPIAWPPGPGTIGLTAGRSLSAPRTIRGICPT